LFSGYMDPCGYIERSSHIFLTIIVNFMLQGLVTLLKWRYFKTECNYSANCLVFQRL
jgi:hypothetical protein